MDYGAPVQYFLNLYFSQAAGRRGAGTPARELRRDSVSTPVRRADTESERSVGMSATQQQECLRHVVAPEHL